MEDAMGFIAGSTAVAIAFWVFVTISAVAGIVSDYKRRKAAIEPLRLAIERGQALDPALVEKLLGRDRQDEPLNPELLQIGGIITTAAGAGVALLSLFLSRIFPQWLLPIMGAGVLVICVGVGLLVATRVLRLNRANSSSAGRASTDRSA
jgi:hypothetical protein